MNTKVLAGNKKLLAGFVVVVALLIGAVYMVQARALVGDTLLVTTFESDGEPSPVVLLQVPFIRAQEETDSITIAIDANDDGAFAQDEQLIAGFPVRSRADWRAGYYARPATPLVDGMAALVTIGGKEYAAAVQTKTAAVGDLMGLDTITDPENAMKGVGAAFAPHVAHAQDIELTQDGVPDLNQRPGECAPTAAANSLISLVDKHGGDDLIPGDPQDFIENLKRHMNWTPENGVPPDDFVAGKNRWAAAAGVPIRTTKVGDTNGLSTIDALRDALENGDAVELRIKFADAGQTRIVGGHMVTVVGLHQDGDQTYLEINDPYTHDSGTEMVEVRQNFFTNYGPYTDGPTILSWGFVQTWEGHPTGELLDTMTDEEIQGIRQFAGDTPMLTVIEHRGQHIQTSKLHIGEQHPPHAEGEGCPERHWHAQVPVTSVEGDTFTDPNPGGCGFGTLSQKPSKNIPAPDRSAAGE